MTRRKKLICGEYRCERPMYMGGLCEQHHQKDVQARDHRDRAVKALHRGAQLAVPTLQEELEALRRRWFRVCDVDTSGRGTRDMPVDEARDAVDWCILYASAILDADPEIAAGKPEPYALYDARHQVGERFRNLDAGLMSNGVPRPPAASPSSAITKRR